MGSLRRLRHAVPWNAARGRSQVAGVGEVAQRNSTEEEGKVMLVNIEAVAMPPRNCDVGTPEQQAKRFEEFCNSHTCTMGDCKVQESWHHLFCDCGLEKVSCGLIFAQMPYEEGGLANG